MLEEKREPVLQENKEKSNKQNKPCEDPRTKERDGEKSLISSSDVYLEQIQTNTSKPNEEQKEKVGKKFNTQQTQTIRIQTNQETKKCNKKYSKKNSQEDLIVKNLTKRKNSSYEEEINSSVKVEKNKNYGKKNCIKKEQKEEEVRERQRQKEEKEKERLKEKEFEEQIKQMEEEEKRVFREFDKLQKMQKESETDSEESYHGDIATLSQ